MQAGGTRPVAAVDEGVGEDATAVPAELSAAIPPLMERLRRLQAEAQARELPEEAGAEAERAIGPSG